MDQINSSSARQITANFTTPPTETFMEATSKSSPSSSLRIPHYLPWLIWGLACAFYFYEFLLQISPNMMTKDLMREFSVTAQAVGILAGIYFWPYALSQIPVGILLDRFGPRRTLTFAAAICSLGALIFGVAPNYAIALCGRILIGVGSAFAVIGSFKLVANWFRPEKFALLAGLTVALGMAGGIFAAGPLGLLIDAIQWRDSMILLAVVGFGLALFLGLLIRDTPKQWVTRQNQTTSSLANEEHNTEKYTWSKSCRDLWGIVQHKQIWLLAIYAGLMYFPTLTFCGLWGKDFLVEYYGLSRANAGAIVSIVFFGWIFGGPFWGWLSDRIHRRLPPMIIGCVGALIASIIVFYLPISLFWMRITLFLFGFFSSGFILAFSVVKESTPLNQAATAMGFMNMLNMVGAAFAQPLVGVILDYLWNGDMINQTPFYTLSNFQVALSVLPVGFFLALLCLPYIRETHCRSAIPHT